MMDKEAIGAAARHILGRLGWAGAGGLYGAANVPSDATQQTKVKVPITSALLGGLLGPQAARSVRGSFDEGKYIRMLGPTLGLSVAPYQATVGDNALKRLRGAVDHVDRTLLPYSEAVGTTARSVVDKDPSPLVAKGTDIATRTAKNLVDDWKPTVERAAGNLGHNLSREAGRQFVAGTVPGLTTYLLARMMLAKPKRPRNTSIEASDEFYNAERKRRLKAAMLGLGAAGVGVGTAVAWPWIQPHMQRGLAGLRNRFVSNS